ncbi:MAG: ABC transporter ATP-binding protein [Trebonia sp.]
MAMVDINGLHKSYGDHEVLRNLDLQVQEGEFLTLLGPSGCGKTTTLRCVAGLERPDGGTVTIGGRVVATGGRVLVPSNRRDIGMVFQSYALWPHMTVFANVAYPLRMRRTDRQAVRQRVGEILEMVGMAPFAQRQVTDLSGGQQPRVALARAMVARPGLLLFDEPLSNLDAKLRHTMRREIRAAHDAAGGSSIYVTHDQQEAITLSDRIIVLRGGTIQQVGSPREIYYQSANAFVADFVGFDNLLGATVTQLDGKGCAVSLDGGAGQVRVAGSSPLAAGARARLAARAEHLDISPLAATADPPAESVAVTVRSRTYTGQHVEYVVDTGQQDLLVRVDEAEAPVGVGDRATVRFDPAKAVVISEAAGESPAGAPQSPVSTASLEEV